MLRTMRIMNSCTWTVRLVSISRLTAFTSNSLNYTYIPLKNNFYINIFPLKTNIFFSHFQLNNIIITFFSLLYSQSLSIYIKKIIVGEQCPLKYTNEQ
ncbi:hypothetical protein Hanom_Chr10g00944641 [Helianthus anomalus]